MGNIFQIIFFSDWICIQRWKYVFEKGVEEVPQARANTEHWKCNYFLFLTKISCQIFIHIHSSSSLCSNSIHLYIMFIKLTHEWLQLNGYYHKTMFKTCCCHSSHENSSWWLHVARNGWQAGWTDTGCYRYRSQFDISHKRIHVKIYTCMCKCQNYFILHTSFFKG